MKINSARYLAKFSITAGISKARSKTSRLTIHTIRRAFEFFTATLRFHIHCDALLLVNRAVSCGIWPRPHAATAVFLLSLHHSQLGSKVVCVRGFEGRYQKCIRAPGKSSSRRHHLQSSQRPSAFHGMLQVSIHLQYLDSPGRHNRR